MSGAGNSEISVNGCDDLARIIGVTARRVLQRERRRADLAITFVSPRQMRQLNRLHLGHDYSTDVITFALPAPNGSLAADIYICRCVAAQNARAHGIPVRQELARLVIHGTLHALGWDHPSGAALTRSAMWRRQERHLASRR